MLDAKFLSPPSGAENGQEDKALEYPHPVQGLCRPRTGTEVTWCLSLWAQIYGLLLTYPSLTQSQVLQGFTQHDTSNFPQTGLLSVEAVLGLLVPTLILRDPFLQRPWSSPAGPAIVVTILHAVEFSVEEHN